MAEDTALGVLREMREAVDGLGAESFAFLVAFGWEGGPVRLALLAFAALGLFAEVHVYLRRLRLRSDGTEALALVVAIETDDDAPDTAVMRFHDAAGAVHEARDRVIRRLAPGDRVVVSYRPDRPEGAALPRPLWRILGRLVFSLILCGAAIGFALSLDRVLERVLAH